MSQNITPGEETEKILLRIAASDHDDLVDAAESFGVLYRGKPAKGTMARKIILRFLRMVKEDHADARDWLGGAA